MMIKVAGKCSPRTTTYLRRCPRTRGWVTEHLVKYRNFWLSPNSILKATLLAQDHFNPKPTDLFLASFPKTGTTWLRALMFSIVNRSRFDISNHPLLTTNPHDCFPFLEDYVSGNTTQLDGATEQDDTSVSSSAPNLYAAHIPFSLLPASIDGCKIVYVCRDPKDVFISKFCYMSKLRPKQLSPLSLEEAFELFCGGISHCGPYWDQALEYWMESLKHPDKVLFLKYEELKREPRVEVKRLAEFLGQAFTKEEENEGKIQQIINLCSFEHLSKLDINKSSNARSANLGIENNHFFRKGVVGDGKNTLLPEMVERLDRITEEKLLGTGLSFG